MCDTLTYSLSLDKIKAGIRQSWDMLKHSQASFLAHDIPSDGEYLKSFLRQNHISTADWSELKIVGLVSTVL